MEIILSEKEKLFMEIAKKVVENWREVMNIDPIWELPIDIYDEDDAPPSAKGALDVSEAQYYRAPVLLFEGMFDLSEEEFMAELNDKVVPHELTHLVAVDFFRTATLMARDNDQLREELRYKYEQFVVRFCKIITTLRNENLRLRYELKKSSAGPEE